MDLFHYLDDFIMFGPPESPLCLLYLDTLKRVCVFLGVPFADHKTNGPTTCILFLGIAIDTLRSELRLLEDKFQCL